MLVYYFVPFIVSNRYLLFWVSNGHNSVTVQNRTHVYMNFFDHKDLGNHLLQLCPKVVKHPVYMVQQDSQCVSCLTLYIYYKIMDWRDTDKTCVTTETGFINLQLLVLGSDTDSLSIFILFLVLAPGVSGIHCQYFGEPCCLQFYKNPSHPSISKCYSTKLFGIISMNVDITDQILITYPPIVRKMTKTWNTMG